MTTSKYKFMTKDKQGNIKSEHVIKIKDNTVNDKTTMGQNERLDLTDQCLIMRISY